MILPGCRAAREMPVVTFSPGRAAGRRRANAIRLPAGDPGGLEAAVVKGETMSSEETRRIRQELGKAFSEEQVQLLRSIRSELSSQRWQVMLEIDGAQEDLRAALLACQDSHLRQALEGIQ